MQENSITLTAEQRDAYRLDAELKQHANTVVGEMIEIGRCLKEISERKLYLLLEAGTFAEYAEKAVGLKERAAYNYIKCYDTYGAEGLQKYGEIGITKLVALAQLNDTDRTELLESGEAAELSSRKLDERIKELKGENDQLRFELDDAETTAKNNAEQIAELKKQLEDITADHARQDKMIGDQDDEIEQLKKQLSEAERPVVASLTDDEKDEIRRAAEKKAKADAKKQLEKLQKQHEEELKVLNTEISVRKENAEKQLGKVKELTAQLEAATVANAELQANAEKAKKPVISGSKEALKFCLEDIQQQFSRAVEIVGQMDGEDKDKFKTALVGISDKLKAAAEGIS